MTLEEKIRYLEAKLEEEPHDYRAVIELMKARSDEIDHKMKMARERRLSEIQKYKEALNGKQAQQ